MCDKIEGEKPLLFRARDYITKRSTSTILICVWVLTIAYLVLSVDKEIFSTNNPLLGLGLMIFLVCIFGMGVYGARLSETSKVSINILVGYIMAFFSAHLLLIVLFKTVALFRESYLNSLQGMIIAAGLAIFAVNMSLYERTESFKESYFIISLIGGVLLEVISMIFLDYAFFPLISLMLFVFCHMVWMWTKLQESPLVLETSKKGGNVIAIQGVVILLLIEVFYQIIF